MMTLYGLRQIIIALLFFWTISRLMEISNLLKGSDVLLDAEVDFESINGDQKDWVREAIQQHRYHPVNRRAGHFEDSILNETYHTNFNGGTIQNRMKPRSNFEPKRKRRRRKDKIPQELLLPKPVILVGFPKAGTSSIFTFFRRQAGFLKCQHWYCCADQQSAQIGGPELMAGCMLRNLVKNRSIFEDCGDFDVYSEINGPRSIKGRKLHRNAANQPGVLLEDGSLDVESYDPVTDRSTRMFFPQYFNLDDIHNSYPNATFILNTRPFDSWIKSVQSWGNDLDWQFINEFYHRGELDSLPNDKTNKTEMSIIMHEIYDRHHERVKQFVTDHPSHTLIVLPILDPNAGNILGEAFGLDSEKWGKFNENSIGKVAWNNFAFLDSWFEQDPASMIFFIFVMPSVFWLLLSVALRRFFVMRLLQRDRRNHRRRHRHHYRYK